MASPSLPAEIINRVDVILVGLVLLVAAAFGGSSLVGIERHAFIQLAAIPLLLWLAVRARPVPWSMAAIGALAAMLVFGLYSLLQLVSLPGLDWREGTPHALVTAAQPMLGLDRSGMGISLAPAETLAAVLAMLPALAVFAAVTTARWSQTVEAVCWLVVTLAAASAGLGLAQLFAGSDSPLYLYGRSGQPLGLFSNPNHQAGFLVMVLPISLALLLDKRSEIGSSDGEIGLFILSAGLFLLLVTGIIAAGSLAGYALLAGVVPLCVLMALPGKVSRSLTITVPVLVVALFGGLAATLFVGLNPEMGWIDVDAPASRPQVWRQSLAIAGDHLPFGTGLGAFEYVYPLYETEGMISSRYMNAAHNEFIQVYVELGIVGVLLAIAAISLWAYLALAAWRTKTNHEGRIRRAASIAGLVVLLHCMVDYPLHAPLYATIAATFAAILCLPPRHERQASRRRTAQPERRIEL